MGRGEGRDLGTDVDRLPESLVAFLGGIAFGRQTLSLAGLLEQRAALRERCLRLGPPVAGARQAVAVPLELGQGELALFDRNIGLDEGLLGDLEAAGVLVAAGRQVVQRL